MLEIIIYIAVFITLSGLLAMIDAAVLSVSKAEIGAMAAKKKYGSRKLQIISGHMPRAVVIIVIFTNLVNVLGPILVGRKAIEIFGSNVLGIITGILTFGTILLSEIIPKSIGVHYAPLISRITAPVIHFLTIVFFPIVIALEWISRLFERSKRKIGTEDQIKSLVKIGRRAGYINTHEERIIRKTFLLNNKTAINIATPLDKVVWFKEDDKIKDVLNQVLNKDFSRYPVFGKNRDDLKGYIISRDLLDAVIMNKNSDRLSSIIHKPLVVENSLKLDKLLPMFKKAQVHLAVVQHKGKTSGIVTLEDLLEELVGEIEDEKDRA